MDISIKQFKSVYLLYIVMIFVGFLLGKLFFAVFIDKAEAKFKMKEIASAPVVVPLSTAGSEESRIAKVAQTSLLAETQTSIPQTPSPKTPPKEVASSEEKTPPILSLNGIFFDEKKPYALVNNQIIKVGDIIEGAKVVRILPTTVDLEFEGESIELRTTR